MTLLHFLQRKKHKETSRVEYTLLCIYNTNIPVQLFTTNYDKRFIFISLTTPYSAKTRRVSSSRENILLVLVNPVTRSITLSDRRIERERL